MNKRKSFRVKMYSTSTKREARPLEGGTVSTSTAAPLQQPQHSQQQQQPPQLQHQGALIQALTCLQQHPSLQQLSDTGSVPALRRKQCSLSIPQPERRPRRQEQRLEGQRDQRSFTKQVPLQERGERAHSSCGGPTRLSLASLAGGSENASSSCSSLCSSAPTCGAIGKSSNTKSNTSAVISNSIKESSASSSSGSIGNRSSISGSVGVGSRFCIGGERLSSCSVQRTSNSSSCTKMSEDAPSSGNSSARAGALEVGNTLQLRKLLSSRRSDTQHGCGAGTGGQPQAARGAPAGVAGMGKSHVKTQQLTGSSSRKAEAHAASPPADGKCEGDRAEVSSTEGRTERAVACDSTRLGRSDTEGAKLRRGGAKSDSSDSRPSVLCCNRAIEVVLTPADNSAIPGNQLPQHGNAAKKSLARAQQKQHPHSLVLPTSEAATSSCLSELGKSGSDISGPQTPANSLSDLRRRCRCSGSCCETADSPAAAPLCEYKGEMVASPGSSAATDAHTAATATKEAEPRGGTSAREAALWRAESFFRKITKHGRPRSASHEPLSSQGGNQKEGISKSQEHNTSGKESVISPWWCREFFLHALHHPNKGGVVLRRRAAQTAAVTAHSNSPHVAGEEDTMETSAEADGVAAAAAEDKNACADSSVLRAPAGGAFAGSSADAGKTAEQHLAIPKARGRETSAQSGATALLRCALFEVKSLPHRLCREWRYLLRARNTAHISHTQRMERADEVRQAALTPAEGNGSDTALSAAAVSAAEPRGEHGVAATPAGSRNRATLQSQRYAESVPGVAGRFLPKSERERLQELQAILLMRQVLPSRETRIRLVQHARRNINKGRSDLEHMAPLLSLRREQLLPCGSTFAVRCLQEPCAAAARMQRKYLRAGRLLGGGSEAMVFAAVEMPPPQLHFHSILSSLIEWGYPCAETASRSVSRNHPSAPFCTAARSAARDQSPNVKSSSGASAGAARAIAGASPTGHAANAVGISDKGQPAPTGDTRRVQQQQQRDRTGLRDDPRQRGHTFVARSGAEHNTVSCSTRHADASSTAVTTGSAESSAEAAGGESRAKGAAHRQTLSSSTDSRIPHQEWGRYWALKWFLCEPFLLYSRRKAEQESAVVEWLQMAFWRLVPLHSITVDIVNQLGIAAPQWIGVIEGMPMVSPGDEQFSMLNRVAAIPLMLGDLLTLSPVDLSVDDRLYCVLRLIQIVASMHAMGVLHNDIKLENIFIGTDGTLHLGDLGTAVPFTGRPMGFQRIGTDVYLDPQSAQEFLEFESLLSPAESQQMQYSQGRPKCKGRQNTHLGSETGTIEATAPQYKPQAGNKVPPFTTGIAAAREDAAVDPGKARTVAAGRGNARLRVARRTVAHIIKRPGGGGRGTGTSSEAAGGDREKDHLRTEQGESRRPFRVVYTPMRDAWAAGVVCYYIWCGGLPPYNLRRAFVGDIKGQDVIRLLARLPSAEKGSRLVFPLGSCPEGETDELLEVRRIIQGLLEPNDALRKTPLEIVQESPLFSAYRANLFGREEKTDR